MWTESKSGIEVLAGTGTVKRANALPPQGLVAIARIDGAVAESADEVFGQFAAAFKFPTYFGWNWDAMSDCLRDMQWLPADRYLVVVEEPMRILSKAQSERRILFGILERAAKDWANPLGKVNGSPISFQTILLAADEELATLERELAGIHS